MQKRKIARPRFNAHGTITIDLWDEQLGRIIPFTADPGDPEEFGRNLHAELVAGKYGKIAAYVAPVATREQVEAQRRRAYAHPDTGSDRLFAEAQRLQLTGQDFAAKLAEANARYAAIKAAYPFPGGE